MLQQLNILVLRTACRLAMRRVAPDLIPRSLPRANGIDCFSLTITEKDREWSLLVDTITTRGASGRWLNGLTYSEPATVTWETALDASIDCSHYIGVYEFHYKSPLALLAGELLLLPRIKIFRDRLQQTRFNRQQLVRRERTAILRLVADHALKSRNYRASSVTLAADLYSNRVFFHPEKEQMLNYCSLLLDSLASSGDLIKDNNAFRLAPRALQTMATHEEEDRRHQDMLAQQRALKWLTFALIFVGLLQVYASWKST